MKWFKFYGQDYLSDPKMLSLTANERSCWITLLSYASVNDNGVITHLCEGQLIEQAGISPMHEELQQTGILQKFVKLGMITLDNETITITNWRKRQAISLTSYERVKRYREKKRMITGDNKNDNSRVDKKRLEENIISDSAKKPNTANLPDSAFKDISYSPLEESEASKKAPNEGRNKIALRLMGKYNQWVKKELGGDERVDYTAKGYILLVKKLKKYSEDEILKIFDWYISSKKFQEHPQITAAISEDSIMRYFKNNA